MVSELPKTANDKVKKQELQKQALSPDTYDQKFGCRVEQRDITVDRERGAKSC